MKEPDGGWGDEDLGKLFTNTAAYKGQVTPLWAYTPDTAGTSPAETATNSPPPHAGSSSFPSYIPPLLGTLLGLFCVIMLSAIIWFIMRRRKQKLAFDAPGSDTEGSTALKNKQTWSWLLGVHGDDKSMRPRFLSTRGYSDNLSASGTGVTTGYHASSGVDSEAYREGIMTPISPLTNDTTLELEGQGVHELPGMPLQLLITFSFHL